MSANRIRRLQRFCWVITILLSALAVVSFYDRTKEYSGYGPKMVEGPPQDWRQMRAMNIPEVGVLFIPRWMPPDPDAELIMAQKCKEMAGGDRATFVVAEVQSINWIRMLGLMVGATVVSAFAIQGTTFLFVRLLKISKPRRRQLVT
jgi:hypothetical protein